MAFMIWIQINLKKQKNSKVKDVILEGGAIDVNGKGTLIATKECLLSKVQERNPLNGTEKVKKLFEDLSKSDPSKL